MCDKIAISVSILKIVEKDPFLKLQIKAEEDFNCNTNKQHIKIKLMQNQTNRWRFFFCSCIDEILVKL